MDFTNTMLTLTQQADAEKPSLFPFPFSMHLIFVIISVIFFSYRFIMQKRPYQIIMPAAILFSMGVWLSDDRTIYYGVGLVDVILILAALVTAIVFKSPVAEETESDDSSNGSKFGGDTAPVWEAAPAEESTATPEPETETASGISIDDLTISKDELTVDQIIESISQED